MQRLRVEPVVADGDELTARLLHGIRLRGGRPGAGEHRKGREDDDKTMTHFDKLSGTRGAGLAMPDRLPSRAHDAPGAGPAAAFVFKGNVRRERPHPRRRDAGPRAARRDPRVRASRSAGRCRAAADRALGGVRHRRASVARTAVGRAVSDHPRPRVRRARWRRFADRCAGSTAPTLREGDRAVFFDVHRTCGRCRACTVHRTPTRCPARRVYGITDPGGGGLVRRLVAGDLSRAWRRHRASARQRQRSMTTSAAAAGC